MKFKLNEKNYKKTKLRKVILEDLLWKLKMD